MTSESVGQIISRAEAMLMQGDIADAESLVVGLIRSNTTALPSDAYVILGSCFLAKGDNKAAMQLVERILPHLPNSFAMGVMLYRIHALAASQGQDLGSLWGLYGQYFAHCIDCDRQKLSWYNASDLASYDDVATQSQRIGESQAENDAEFAYIAETLRLSAADRVLDVGGAGGLFAARMARAVASVTLTDVSADLIEKAKANLGEFQNVQCLQSDIVEAAPAGTFTKVLMASVTPAFSSWAALSASVSSIFCCLEPGGLCLISNSYDINSAERAARGYLTDRAPKSFAIALSKLHRLENMLWIDVPRLMRLCGDIGFASCAVQNERTLADGRRMFDIALVR